MPPWMQALGIALEVCLIICAVFIASCDESEATARPPEPRSAADVPAGYEPVEVGNGGTISGIASWVGPPPEPIEIPVELHPDVCGASQRSPSFRVGRRRGLADVVVWLDGIRQGKAFSPSTEPRTIALSNCAFEPHIAAVPVGTTLSFENRDGILHNVRATEAASSRRRATWFSEALPNLSSSFRRLVEARGITQLVDDAGHPWMHAFVHAFDHPYFAVSDLEGRFHLSGIPAGQYTLRAWHEGVLSTHRESGRPVYSAPIVLSRPITITAGHDSAIDLSFGLEAARAAGE